MENNTPRKPYNGFIGTPAAKVLGLITAFAVTFLMMYMGAYTQYCLFAFVGALLFIIPKMFGVKDFKAMAVLGLAFFLVTSLVGSFLVSVPAMESMKDREITGDFSNCTITNVPGTGTYDITVDYAGASAPTVHYVEISSCSFAYLFGQNKTADMTLVSGTTYKANIPLTDDRANILYFVADDKSSEQTLVSETLNGDTLQRTAISGNMYVNGIPTVMFFLILLFSTWMRRNFEKQREKFEAEGRLYPKGYGLCKNCGMTVLPGEKVCRKCGTPIDIPEEIQRETLAKLYGTVKCPVCCADVVKIEKVCPKCKTQMPGFKEDGTGSEETFRCSDCGAEVPADSSVCPSCGARFDDDIGTVTCKECGAEVPADEGFCPKCGASFKKN
ncbi:MAG: zinc-ribbon domain-containing protein [Candidatus Methanomethylophilaceae archaeon]|nr:zinc-ribbon domain-containing protein [Candidatus Methanomethylophilaceae archaeon]